MESGARTALLLALLALPAWTLDRPAPATPLVGTWHVAEWWVRDTKSGERQYPYGRQPTGYYVFDATGRMFVHIAGEDVGNRMPPGRWRTLPADRLRELIERRLAYFGSYSVDAARGVIAEHVESDLVRELSGASRDVPFRIDGDRLLLGDGTTWQAVLMRAW